MKLLSVMKTPYLTIVVFLLTLSSSLAQSLRFLDVVQQSRGDVAVDAQINERGGYISFDRIYRSGCTGGYKVKVTLSNSLNMLQPGETFQVTLSCEHCNTPCDYKWGIVELFSSGNVTGIQQYPNYIYNENIEFVGSSNGSSGVADWAPGRQNNIITFKYDPKKEVPLTAIKIVVAGDHDIFIVFSSGSSSEPNPPSVGKPNLSCTWKSNYGDIHWENGYYGSTSKSLSGELFQRDGVWTYEGVWGRKGSSRWGRVYFRFTSATTFEGYWTEKDGTKQTKWTGSGECLLIKY